jgi:hypothetical protein
VKVLLDENLDHRLREQLVPHEVFTVSFQGWGGLRNGALLAAAEDAGFQVFLTGDQSLPAEQNLSGRLLTIVVLSAVEWRILKHHIPAIAAAIDQATPGSLQRVACGTFTRKT